MARELVILPRLKRDYRSARKHPEFDSETTECHLGADLLLIYRVRRDCVILHRIGTHTQLFTRAPRARRTPRSRKSK